VLPGGDKYSKASEQCVRKSKRKESNDNRLVTMLHDDLHFEELKSLPE